tara:strand:- start:2084 stop:2446 length:363 start_codon:yes stop_codon:yes gene_type:complete
MEAVMSAVLMVYLVHRYVAQWSVMVILAWMEVVLSVLAVMSVHLVWFTVVAVFAGIALLMVILAWMEVGMSAPNMIFTQTVVIFAQTVVMYVLLVGKFAAIMVVLSMFIKAQVPSTLIIL